MYIDGVDGYTPMSFLSAVRTEVTNLLLDSKQTKVKMVLYCKMERTDLSTGETAETTAPFASRIHLYSMMEERILENLVTFQSRGSNWAFVSIIDLTIHTVQYKPLRGNSYIPLPKNLKDKKALINMKNEDDECFKWCITLALNPVERNPQRVTTLLREQSESLNWEG